MLDIRGLSSFLYVRTLPNRLCPEDKVNLHYFILEEEYVMSAVKILAIVLILAGVLGLAYGGFSYLAADKAKIGPIELTIKNWKTVNVPIWASLVAIATGVVLLVIPKKS